MGDELKEGFGLSLKIQENIDRFEIDIVNQSMTIPESAVYALGLPCVLAVSNCDQQIGQRRYFYRDFENVYIVDEWWGKIDEARTIMSFDKSIRVKMDFKNVLPHN